AVVVARVDVFVWSRTSLVHLKVDTTTAASRDTTRDGLRATTIATTSAAASATGAAILGHFHAVSRRSRCSASARTTSSGRISRRSITRAGKLAPGSPAVI